MFRKICKAFEQICKTSSKKEIKMKEKPLKKTMRQKVMILGDADGVMASGLPVWCPGAAAPASVANLSDGELEVPIGCGGVAVIPGDWIIADNDGVVVVPKAIAEEIANDGLEQEIHEVFILEQVRNGAEIPGHYPPNEENVSKYKEWRIKRNLS